MLLAAVYPYNFFHQYLNSTISFILVLEGLNPFTLPQVFLAKLNQEDHPTCRRFSSWKEHNISINVIVVRAHLLVGVDFPRALEPILHLPPADFWSAVMSSERWRVETGANMDRSIAQDNPSKNLILLRTFFHISLFWVFVKALRLLKLKQIFKVKIWLLENE